MGDHVLMTALHPPSLVRRSRRALAVAAFIAALVAAYAIPAKVRPTTVATASGIASFA